MDFGAKVLYEIQIAGKNIWITETLINTWVLMALIILFAIIVRIRLRNFQDVPNSKFQNFIEIIVESMDGFVSNSMGRKYSYFGSWFFTVFTFILVCNFSSLLGFRPPTADLATTAALGLSTFVLIHFMGITKGKSSYFKGYFEPIPVLFPLNVISEVATPISLSLRLFGNILGGTIIMGLVYNFLPIIAKYFGLPAILHAYFDVFAGFLQTFIFVILSMTFIKDKIPD